MVKIFCKPIGLALLLAIALPATAAEYPDPSVWERVMIGFRLQDEVSQYPDNAIVMTGSSSMRFWHDRIHQDLEPLTVISRGFGGSNMNDLHHYLQEVVLTHSPRAVVIYEGDNDVWQEVPVERILEAYHSVVSDLHEVNPDLRIYLVSVKPSISRLAHWPTMQDLNHSIKAICDDTDNVTYIDVATPMLTEEGLPKPDIFIADELHLNQKGYDIWSKAIREVLLPAEKAFEP